ncbi:hypothetical protein [Luteimicrobium subarcticum]|uniref:Uncharacterized protein n=1 Tax=Luteimicrobium subarcticum TaxID=620910 RepID=A0A2M8WTY8_9MICO|nr:hypothetical protein [Luteimicrobium subarcticum]PJI94369.1 hypothetical protein CLV34_0205 [Luteimicrobium subarcticum]
MPWVDVRVPGTALLVPGVAGRADVLVGERREVLAALRRALGGAPPAHPAPVTVLAAAGSAGRPVPDLGPVGVAARWARWSFHGNDATASGRADVPTSVALLALGAAGWDGPVDVVVPHPGHDGGRPGDVVVRVVVRDVARAGAQEAP